MYWMTTHPARNRAHQTLSASTMLRGPRSLQGKDRMSGFGLHDA